MSELYVEAQCASCGCQAARIPVRNEDVEDAIRGLVDEIEPYFDPSDMKYILVQERETAAFRYQIGLCGGEKHEKHEQPTKCANEKAQMDQWRKYATKKSKRRKAAETLEALRGDKDISRYDRGTYILTPEAMDADHPLAVVVEVGGGSIVNVHPVSMMEVSESE